MNPFKKLSSSNRNIATNVSWALVGKAVSMGIGLITTVMLTRYLGKEGFGLFAALTALVAIGQPLSDAGLNAIVSRHLLDRPEDEARILGSANRIRIVATAIVTLVLWLVAVYGMRLPHEQLMYVAVLLIAFLARPIAVITFWFEAKRTNKHAIWAEIVGNGLRTLLIGTFILLKKPVGWMIFAQALSPIFSNAVSMVFYLRMRTVKERWSYDRGLAISMASKSWFLILSSVANIINLKVDQVLLLEMAGKSATGIYSAAVRISEIWYSVPIILMGAMFPSLYAARQQSPEKFAKRLQQMYDAYALLAFSLAIVLTLGGRPLVTLLFGHSFRPAGPILAVHTWGGVFVFMQAIFSRWLVMEDLYWYSMVRHGSGAVTNVIFNLILIPRYGAMGSAVATVLSYGTSGYMSLLFTKRTREQWKMMSLGILAPVRYLPKAVRLVGRRLRPATP